MKNFEARIARARALLAGADALLIGGGAGLSAAAGLTYSGERFQTNFPDFIAKYGMQDMYSAGFYPFPTQEEKWAYWSRHIFVNRISPPALPLYRELFSLVQGKDYFVITTNVDAQFEKAGFERERIFAVQGDYQALQCARGCQNRVYDGEARLREMVNAQKDCRVPSSLVPKCPVCGGEMEVHIRKDEYFVEDEKWHAAKGRYEAFLSRTEGKRMVLLELGVGYNTPAIIRFPFERMTYQSAHVSLIRINRDEAEALKENAQKTVCFSEDMGEVFSRLGEKEG